MSRHDDETRLRHMLEYTETAVEAIRGRVRPDLDHDVVLVAAMERFVEIIGEAAGRISEERKEGIADVRGARSLE